MIDGMPHSPEVNGHVVHAKGQAALVEFLRVDLALAFTILRTAEIQAADGLASASGVAKVREALKVVRRLEDRIEDPRARIDIHHRADELEAALQAFPS